MVHETQMEPGTDKVLLDIQCFLISFYRHVYQLRVLVIILTHEKLSLALICQTLRMEKFGVVWCKFQSLAVVIVGLSKLLFSRPIQIHVTTIE